MLSDALLLFFVIDPFGLIPLYESSLRKVPLDRRMPVLVRELFIALIVLVAFLFAGKRVLAALHISEPALVVSSALILFLIALPMMFPSIKLSMEAENSPEPFIVPLATPLFAGPSALAFVILMASRSLSADWPSWLGAVLLAWAAASIVVLLGHVLARRIDPRALIAIERVMGMLLIAIAVEMMLSGISRYITSMPG